MSTILTEISPLVDVLRNLSSRGIKCNLLVGAGCSVTAGIPTASGIMKIIEEKYPYIYSTVNEKTYANCMNALSPDERVDLIKSLVNDSKLNITHIIIAELLKKGYIHRILTPNFDNLLIKACSIVNEYPPIYDLAAYEEFQPEHIPETCIFYLHGQFTGFKLMNTNEEVTEQAKKLRGLFHRLNERSVWIIVGFSGLNDALFQLLSEEKIYSNRLYWVGYDDHAPHKELKEKILAEGKFGFYIKGFNSDSFFWNLANRLDTFPPSFLLRPFSYIKNILDQIVPYQPNENLDLNKATGDIVQNAIDQFEKDPVIMADCYYKFGLYDHVIEMEDILMKKEQTELLANAYFQKAYRVGDEAERIQSIELHYQTIRYYKKSFKLDRFHGCLNNTGYSYYMLSSLEEDRYEEHINASLRQYLMAMKRGSSFALQNFVESVMNYLNKNAQNKIALQRIADAAKGLDEELELEPFSNWINMVIDRLSLMEIANPSFCDHLSAFQSWVRKELRDRELDRSG